MIDILIEVARQKLNSQIRNNDTYDSILKTSQKLDKFLNYKLKLELSNSGIKKA